MSGRRFDGKVALVTGGASGMGQETCKAFAREGAKVAVVDCNVEGGEQTVAAIRDAGGEALFVRADVSKPREVERMVAKAVETWGRLDCAYNNAGIDGGFARIDQIEDNAFERVVEVNLRGVWLGMKYQIRQMLKQGAGTIVNTASNAAFTAVRGMSVYAAAKAGVVALTRTAAVELGPHGIRVNAICPGTILTGMAGPYLEAHPDAKSELLKMAPVGRLGEPKDIAATALFLCSDESAYLTGLAVSVDGGMLAQSGTYPPTPE